MSNPHIKKLKHKRLKAPKPIEAPKPERPKRSELKGIYKDLLSADRETRLDALARAMAWYDKLIVYTGYKQNWKWRTSQLREKNPAERDRGTGIQSSDSKKKEVEFVSAIQHYEKIAPNFKPPLIGKFLKKLKQESPKLEARKKKLVNKFGEWLQLVKDILKPTNHEGKAVDIYVDKLKTPWRISTEGHITLDRKLVGRLRTESRRQGMMAAFTQFQNVIGEAGGRQPELDPQQHKTGKTVVSHKTARKAVEQMWTNVFQYYMKAENPKKLVRRVKPKKERNEQRESTKS